MSSLSGASDEAPSFAGARDGAITPATAAAAAAAGYEDSSGYGGEEDTGEGGGDDTEGAREEEGGSEDGDGEETTPGGLDGAGLTNTHYRPPLLRARECTFACLVSDDAGGVLPGCDVLLNLL